MDEIKSPEDQTNPNGKKLHIQDLCPTDREKIVQLVKKLAECTQMRHKAETELTEIRSENQSLINRYDICCNEHETEKAVLQQQLEAATNREKTLKLESSKALGVFGEQLEAQEREFVKLTETVKDLLREKIQLQNAMIEKESRVRIAESKLERAKETFAMEKLLFIKEHAKDSVQRKLRDRGTQTPPPSERKDHSRVSEKSKVSSKVKSKQDLDDPSGDGILLRSLFFKSANHYEDEHFASLEVLNCPIK